MTRRAAAADAGVVHHPRLVSSTGWCDTACRSGVVGMWFAGLPRHPGRERGGRAVTGATIAGRRMVGVLRRRRPGNDGHTGETLAGLVTGRARRPRHRRMIHWRAWAELGRRGVTCDAVGIGRDVARSLRQRRHAVERRPRRSGGMARRAAAADPGVLHRGAGTKGCEIRRRVTAFADGGRWNVIHRLRLEVGHTGERLAGVVTGCAATADSGVLHRRARTELGGRRVAGHAVSIGRDVARSLRQRRHAVESRAARAHRVARRAAADDAGVVHHPRLVQAGRLVWHSVHACVVGM